MALLTQFQTLLRTYRRRRSRQRAERALASLSLETLKDIGWPDIDAPRPRRPLRLRPE